MREHSDGVVMARRRHGDGAATCCDGAVTTTAMAWRQEQVRRGAATALQNRGDRYGDGVAALAWLQVRR